MSVCGADTLVRRLNDGTTKIVTKEGTIEAGSSSKLPADFPLPAPPNSAIFIATPDGGAALNPNAGQITAAGPPRQMQLGVKLVF